MRREIVVTVMAVMMVGAAATSSFGAVPSETPADTYQLNGPRVRTILPVGSTVWIGGRFTQVQDGQGAKVADVVSLAALDLGGTALSSTATPLSLGGATNPEVWSLATDGTTIWAAGKFSVTAAGKVYKNLLAFDAVTGSLVSSFRPTGIPVSQAVAVSDSRVFVGSKKLIALDKETGSVVAGFQQSSITTDASLRGHNTPPQFRDLEVVGPYIYSACQCDQLTQGGQSRGVKALVRFDASTGNHDATFSPEGAGVASVGMSLAFDGDDVYLGAGGSDFVAKYSTILQHNSGSQIGRQYWKRDTSGSAQVVLLNGDDLLVGGHFVEIADAPGDNCGFRSSNPGTLDPQNQCIARERLAAYSPEGTLQPWDPSVTGKYNGVWALALTGSSLHVGGEFLKVHNVNQDFYARLD